ncbi:MAG TPA: CRISPR-associated endonuclease Cas2 [Chromatiaceae bacterium]|nr:CRISPR-associated endonuclease Cas2 [Chromatiaceae bacterium]
MTARTPYLICYDIADSARLAKVNRFIRRHALRIQYSVYYLETEVAGLKALIEELDALIDPKMDDVRIYPLATNPPPTHLGRPLFPRGILLCGQGGLFTAPPDPDHNRPEPRDLCQPPLHLADQYEKSHRGLETETRHKGDETLPAFHRPWGSRDAWAARTPDLTTAFIQVFS